MSEDVYIEEIFEKDFPFENICKDKEFSECKFLSIDFSNFDLSGSTFLNCKFDDCNFSNTVVNNCSFKGIVLNKCKFVGILFSRINTFLHSWEFNKCKLELCMFESIDIKNSKFLDCKIFDCNFIEVVLKDSIFSGSDLKDTSFERCDLRNNDFRGSKNYYFDISDNRVKGSIFSQPEVLTLLKKFEVEIE